MSEAISNIAHIANVQKLKESPFALIGKCPVGRGFPAVSRMYRHTIDFIEFLPEIREGWARYWDEENNIWKDQRRQRGRLEMKKVSPNALDSRVRVPRGRRIKET